MNSLLNFFRKHSQEKSVSCAIFDFDRDIKYTWEDLNLASDNIAVSLRKNHSSSFIIYILSEQNINFYAALIACWKCDKTPFPLSPETSEYEFKSIYEQFDLNEKVLLIDEGIKESVKIDSNKYRPIYLNKTAKTEVHNKQIKEQVIQEAAPELPQTNDDLKSPALALMTSGTTAEPVIYLFSHPDLFHSAQIEMLNEPEYKNACIANLRPHFTSAGLNSFWPSLLLGCSNIVSEQLRTKPLPRALNELIQKKNITHLLLSPTYIIGLLALDDSILTTSEKDIFLYFGGSFLPEQILLKLLKIGFKVSMRYGMTEVGHIISKKNYCLNTIAKLKTGDVGMVGSGFEVVSQNNFLTVSSDGIATFKMQKKEKVLNLKLPFITSDQGYIDESGHIILQGRENTIININGFRFLAAAVEKTINQSGFVLDCRVLGVEQADKNFLLVCFYIRKKEYSDIENELRRYLNHNLSRHKRPVMYVELQGWPKSQNGKIDFNKLKQDLNKKIL